MTIFISETMENKCNNTEYTFAADSVSKYIGGSFPDLTINNSVDLRSGDITSLEIKGETINSTEDATKLDQLLENIEVVYTYEDGTIAIDDKEAGEYTVTLKWKNGLTNEDVRVNGNEVNLDGVGTLIVRDISDDSGAQEDKNTFSLLTEEPTTPADHTVAIAKESSILPSLFKIEFYTNNDENRVINAEGIRILDDDLLIDEDGTDRQALLEQKAVDSGLLPALGEKEAYRYDFHYLDLVDAYNGNAWVSASYGTIVYLPYPDGMSYDEAKDITFTIVHYPELHREYGISGQAEIEDAIAACNPEVIPSTNTQAGIRFELPREGFSPFAIVWQTDAHTITATSNEGGTIGPSGEVIVAEGENQTFEITPDAGYKIASVNVNGNAIDLQNILAEDGSASYTFEKVESDQTIDVTFEKITYTISASAGVGGTIDQTGEVTVVEGENQTFMITPNAGYEIGEVKVDGTVVDVKTGRTNNEV